VKKSLKVNDLIFVYSTDVRYRGKVAYAAEVVDIWAPPRHPSAVLKVLIGGLSVFHVCKTISFLNYRTVTPEELNSFAVAYKLEHGDAAWPVPQ
jgi:hypothetical protein